jgi:predicted enzyme related to lactoylglutathione lyase
MIYIVVEDIDAAATQITARGGEIVARKGGTLIARDPEGNAFSLWAPPKKG